MEESELVRQCQKADRKAQELLFSRFADKLYRIAFRYVKSEQETEDIVIVSFGKVFEKIGAFSYKGKGSLDSWLRRIVVNEALMSLRRVHNFHLTESVNESSGETDLSALNELGADDIYNMITDLPTGYRTVFNLNVVEGYPHTEIAAMLGISENSSRSQLFKAKALLKKKLSREGFQYGT